MSFHSVTGPSGVTYWQCDVCDARTTSTDFIKVHVCGGVTGLGKTVPDSEAELILDRTRDVMAESLEAFKLLGSAIVLADLVKLAENKLSTNEEKYRKAVATSSRQAGIIEGARGMLQENVQMLRMLLTAADEDLEKRGWRR